MSEDMPRTWWDGTDYRWLYDEPRQKLPGAYAMSGDHFPAAVGPDWFELKPVSDAPPAPVETEWAAIHEDGTVIDCVDQDEARYYRDNPRHSHRDGYRAVRRAVIRSEWQEVTADA